MSDARATDVLLFVTGSVGRFAGLASAYECFHRLTIAGRIVLIHKRLVRIEARLSNSLARVC